MTQPYVVTTLNVKAVEIVSSRLCLAPRCPQIKAILENSVANVMVALFGAISALAWRADNERQWFRTHIIVVRKQAIAVLHFSLRSNLNRS